MSITNDNKVACMTHLIRMRGVDMLAFWVALSEVSAGGNAFIL